MTLRTVLELGLAAAVVVVAISLGAAVQERVAPRILAALAGVLGAAATAAWVAFALRGERELAVAAAGLTATVAGEAGALGLLHGLRRRRETSSELDRVETHLEGVAQRLAEEGATQLEHALARARADSLSLLFEEERRLADEHRRGFAERAHEATERLAEATRLTQERIEQRLASAANDFERIEAGFARQVKGLERRQQQLIEQAEAPMRADAERVEAAASEQRQALAAMRMELERAVGEAAGAAGGELEVHAVDRRRALHGLEEQLRGRERQLAERIEREAVEAAARISSSFADTERRQIEALERVVTQAAGRFSEAAALQFEAAVKVAREDAARRLARELERALENSTRDAQSVLAERLAQVADAGGRRLEVRLKQVTEGLERQRDEFVAAFERRLGDAEEELRGRLRSVAREAEAEHSVLKARLHELSRRIDQTATQARELDSLRAE